MTDDELSLLQVKAAMYDKLLAILPMGKPENLLKFKSFPEDEKVQAAVSWMLTGTIHVLRQELELAPPGRRNRMTMTVEWPDELWTLTLKRGDFEHAVEKQRDQARAELEVLRARILELDPTYQLPTTDEVNHGNDSTDSPSTQEV